MRSRYTSDDVARCCTMGLLLELAVTPKPGLVDRLSDPKIYVQFLASSTALYKHFRAAASAKSVGKVIREACKDMLSWQHGGNTHLGSLLLLTPLAAAATRCKTFSDIRPALRDVLEKMGYIDTLNIFKAIRDVNPGHLGHVAYLDVYSDKTYRTIVRRRLGVLEALKPYSGYEVVATEYSTCYHNSFVHGYQYLRKQLDKTDFNTAGVNTFLNILKHLPDSHVSRMYGRSAARMLSRMAADVLEAGGLLTVDGRRLFGEMAEKIKVAGFKPAATADILATSYSLLLLNGWRP